MNNPITIMIVDDVAENRLILQMILEADYLLIEADSGKNCLALVSEKKPDLILLDINMPGISGYDVCKELRSQPETQFLPIVFVSALDDPKERLAGFEAGGDEYLTKPVDRDELLEKIKYRLAQQHLLANAQKEAMNAMNVAMEAMTSSSELGRIIQFVKILNDLEEEISVAKAINEMIEEFGLSVCVTLTGENVIHMNCEKSSFEAKLMQHFQSQPERIFSAGARTIVRSEKIVLLIKNMPVENENLYGRLKDHLVVLADMASNRLLTLQFQSTMDSQRKFLINDIIDLAKCQISLTSEKIINHEKTVQNTMQNMVSELEEMLFGLGLEEDQEKALLKLADNATCQLEQSNRSTAELDAELGVILESLHELLGKEASVKM